MKKKISFSIECLEARSMMSTFTPDLYKDPETRSLLRSYLRDDTISRDEYISVIKWMKDGSGVDLNELNDLKTLSNQIAQDYPDTVIATPIMAKTPLTSLSKITGYLTDPFLNKGRQLQLGARSELDRLVNKWFNGSDLPTANSVYKPFTGQLFVNGPSHTDVKQGQYGTCYLLSALQSVADKDPRSIFDAIQDNGNYTYTVRFFVGQNTARTSFFVTVNNMFPTDCSRSTTGSEMWVSIYEKAYAQLNETGYTERSGWAYRDNSYRAIEGGFSNQVYTRLYWQQAVYSSARWSEPGNNTEQILQDAIKNKRPISVYVMHDKYTAHAYYLRSYENGKYTLINPWAYSHRTVTVDELKKDMYGYSVAPSYTVVIPIAPITISPKASVAKTFFAMQTNTKYNYTFNI